MRGGWVLPFGVVYVYMHYLEFFCGEYLSPLLHLLIQSFLYITANRSRAKQGRVKNGYETTINRQLAGTRAQANITCFLVSLRFWVSDPGLKYPLDDWICDGLMSMSPSFRIKSKEVATEQICIMWQINGWHKNRNSFIFQEHIKLRKLKTQKRVYTTLVILSFCNCPNIARSTSALYSPE